jgi:hypothetical protein
MHRATVLLAATAAALLLAGGAVGQSCVGSSVTVKNTGMKTALPVNTSNAFDLQGVEQHFESIAPFDDFKSNVGSTFYCVDSRGEYDELVIGIIRARVLGKTGRRRFAPCPLG